MHPLPALVLLLVCNHGAYVGLRIATSIMSLKEFGFSPALNGTLMALYGLVPAFFAIATGRYVDRVGFARPMLAGSAVLLAGAAMIAAAPSPATLFIGATAASAGFMLYQIALQHAFGMIGRPEDRTVNFSWLAFGFSCSGLLGPVLAGIGIDTIGYRGTFAVFAACTVIPLLAVATGKAPLPAHAAPPASAGRGHFLDLLTDPRMRYVYLVTALTAIGWDLFTFFVPVYGASIGLSATRIGAILGVFGAATVLVRFAMPFFARRVNPTRIVLATLVTTGLGYLAFPLASSVAVLMVIAFVLGLALGTSQPMVLGLLYSGSPAGRIGEALGLRQTIVNTAQAVVPIFFGLAGTAVGMLPVCWVVAGAQGWGLWVIRKRRNL